MENTGPWPTFSQLWVVIPRGDYFEFFNIILVSSGICLPIFQYYL